MRAVIGLLGVLIVAGVGLFIYRAEFTGKSGAAANMGTDNPRAVVDVTGVEADLTAMAQAERGLLAQNGRYGTLEELESSGSVQEGRTKGRFGYTYSVESNEHSFTITAKYAGPATGMPTLSIDETMQIARK
jgi:hypothetical protein